VVDLISGEFRGLSTQSLKIDYAAYLVYAYNVISVPLFAGNVFQLVLLFPFLYYLPRRSGRGLSARPNGLERAKGYSIRFPQFGGRAEPLRSSGLYSSEQLHLLAESETDYFVLNQPPYDPVYHQLPTGFVYWVHKSDVLVFRIILRSQTIK
jgi:hypothetical protein